jgi:hypothetical protein
MLALFTLQTTPRFKVLSIKPVVNMGYAPYPTILASTACDVLTITVITSDKAIDRTVAHTLAREIASAMHCMVSEQL